MRINPFFKSKVFFKHIGFAFLLSIAIVSLVLFGLKLYTRHNQFFIVPNLYGMGINEANEILEEDNLHIKITDSLYQNDGIPGSILEQIPKADIKVKKHRNISVIICSSKPESIPFPNIKNMAFRQTLNTLTNLGFKIGKLNYKEHAYKNLVLELKYKNNSIIAGRMIEKGSSIDIVLGKGENNTRLIPLVIGKTIEDAKNIIKYSYLNVGNIYNDNTIKTKKDLKFARIWKQSPEYDKNRKLKAGNKITLWLSLDSLRLLKADSLVIKNRKLTNKKW
jgi:beta-lactam-binding protein with PASTA domain